MGLIVDWHQLENSPSQYYFCRDGLDLIVFTGANGAFVILKVEASNLGSNTGFTQM